MSAAMLKDLESSGLEVKNLDARELGSPERAAMSIPASVEGYVIPYFKPDGSRLPFYRAKLFNHTPKYKQPRNTPNYLYFPYNFRTLLTNAKKATDPLKKVIILTEGEKKAAACSYITGFPACALSGVDSWKSKSMALPEGTELLPGKKKGQVIAKFKDAGAEQLINEGEYAQGFMDLVNALLDPEFPLTLIIVYDIDPLVPGDGLKFEVKRAAAVLGYELRHLGVPTNRIRYLALPKDDVPIQPDNENPAETKKVGLDDWLAGFPEKSVAASEFTGLIEGVMKKRNAFPCHPNAKDFINKKLQSNRINRKESQKIAISVLTELDAAGLRLRDKGSGNMFFFAEKTRILTPINMQAFTADLTDISAFGLLLFDWFGIGRSDKSVTSWLAQFITSEAPIIEVTPRRIVYADRHKNIVNYQLNDGQYIRITGDPAHRGDVCDNGKHNMLFQSGMVDGIPSHEYEEELKAQAPQWHSPVTPSAAKDAKAEADRAPNPCWWHDVIASTRLKNKKDLRHMRIVSMMPYLSPWLNRWRETQLPVELVIGESGSGKSTLLSLRLNILTGRQELRNTPDELKDYHSSIVNSGGLHVTDNVKLDDKALRQKLSDEVCRIVTEPEPHIEMRRLYSTADLARFPVDVVFAFTAITQPFPNPDLIARAVIMELDKSDGVRGTAQVSGGGDSQEAGDDFFGTVAYGSAWLQERFTMAGRYGTKTRARAAWIAHHTHFLSRLFEVVDARWNNAFNAKHRLVNFEQLLQCAAEVFGWDEDGSYRWIGKYLAESAKQSASDADWALEGIGAWADLQREIHEPNVLKQAWHLSDIVDWCMSNDEYKDCTQLTNARRLGRYIQQHKALVQDTSGLIEVGKYHGMNRYKLTR